MKSITSSTTAGLGRREFLLRTGLGAASVFFPWVARGNPLGANERIRIGVIGCGGISRGHLALGSHPWVELRALCDVKSDVLAEALAFGRTFNPDCQGFADYGGLKELKNVLESQFDHTLLVAEDDPELETYKLLESKNMAKLTILPRLGCEGLADMLYKYVNGVYIPDMWGQAEADRLWCYRVEVRETQSNMAFREGHREWNENLFE